MSHRFTVVAFNVLGCLAFAGLVSMWAAREMFIEPLLGFRIGVGMVAVGVIGAVVIKSCVATRHREYLHESIVASQLSAETRAFFDQESPVLEALGFQCLGDFRTLPDPLPEVMRGFISPGGKCFATLVEHDGYPFLALSTVAEDDTYLESTTLPAEKFKPAASIPLRLQFLGDEIGIVDAIERHRGFVEEYGRDNNVELHSYSPDDLASVLDYGHRLASWDGSLA